MKQMKFFCGVITALLTMGVSATMTSCNSDDEYYETSNYTLAKKRITRSAENGHSYSLKKQEYVKFCDSVSCSFTADYVVTPPFGGSVAISDVNGYEFTKIELRGPRISVLYGDMVNILYNLKAFHIEENESQVDTVIYDTIEYNCDVLRKYPLSFFQPL